MIWLSIAVGGALGAVARHAVSTMVSTRTAAWTTFPTGTVVVNVMGCFLAGLLLGQTMRLPMSTEVRAFLAVGVLGGFTTFSAFGVETFLLMQNGHAAAAVANVIGSVVLALVALWVGFAATA